MEIVFVGNISKDTIKNNYNNIKTVFGGSALYSSLACKFCNDKLNIGVLGKTNEDLINVIEKNNISFLGEKVDICTEFNIDEEKDSCYGKNYKKISTSKKINTEHLHISFRKGVDIEEVLNNENIKYNTLSVDVMIYSVNEIKEKLFRYAKKINIFFCKLEEYVIIKDYVKDIKIKIITNGPNPIIIINNEKVKVLKVKGVKKPKSTTGAGDSFIGGFLSEWVKSKNVENATIVGRDISKISLKDFGPVNLRKNNKTLKDDNKFYFLPKNIIIIGNSCAGKSTIVNEWNKYFNIYKNIDDIIPLKEVFDLDDEVRENEKILFEKGYKKNIKYIKKILNQYKKDYPNIKFNTIKNLNGKGHDIINPKLWDEILKFSIVEDFDVTGENIIQLARGKDENYEKMFNKNGYINPINYILESSSNKEDNLIIYIYSDFKNRIYRNIKREEKGEHFVSETTMENVYKEEYFKNLVKNQVYVYNEIKTPFIIINNKEVNELEIEKAMKKIINKIIRKYNKYKEQI